MDSVLLIIKSNVKNRDAADNLYLPPLGVMSIGTYLEMHGYHVEIIDQSVTIVSGQDIIDKIEELNPIYVGISAYTENFNECLKLCKYIKRKRPMTKIAVGGAHVSLAQDVKLKGIDFILRGEGEAASLELAEAIRTNEKLISYSEIEGLTYKQDEKTEIKNEDRKPMKDLDVLPLIKRKYIQRALESYFVTISSSRGCPGKCIYCAAPKMAGARYRIRDIENVFMETLLALTEAGWDKEVYYIDDTFTAFVKRVRRYVELIKESKLQYKWRCESRVDALYGNGELVKEMVERGCQRLQYGIESGNQDVLNKIHKQMNIEQAEELIDFSVGTGVRVALSFIFGHYCDTKETMNDTLSFMERMYSKHFGKIEIYYSFNTPFPGTEQYERLEELGMKWLTNKYEELDLLHPVVVTDQFDLNMLNEFGNKARLLMQIR